MAAVYKTLSGNDHHEKDPGEKRNKQRVLILVSLSHETNALVLTAYRVREASHSGIAIFCRIFTHSCSCFSSYSLMLD